MLEPLKGQRQKSESDKAVQACNDWLRLGPGRTLASLLKPTETDQNRPVTGSIGTLKEWASKFNWAERAVEYDGDLEGQKNDRYTEVMSTGLALDYERVDRLKRMADFLEAQIYEQGRAGNFHNVWIPDAKSLGAGPMATVFDYERFNGPLLSEFRSTLDDIAKETGGRRVKTEITGSLTVTRKAEDLTDDELAAVASTGGN